MLTDITERHFMHSCGVLGEKEQQRLDVDHHSEASRKSKKTKPAGRKVATSKASFPQGKTFSVLLACFYIKYKNLVGSHQSSNKLGHGRVICFLLQKGKKKKKKLFRLEPGTMEV